MVAGALGDGTRDRPQLVEDRCGRGAACRTAQPGFQNRDWLYLSSAQMLPTAVGPTFFRSAARGLHVPTARRAASREARRGSAGPAYGRASAAAKSYAARPIGWVPCSYTVRSRR